MSQDATTRALVQRMRDERYRRGWSAQELSEKVTRDGGVPFPRSIIANLENGRRDDFPIGEIVGVAKVFNTSVTWLLYGTGIACTQCNDAPPAGFTCNDCGKSTSTRVADVLDQTAFFASYVQAVKA